MSGASFAISNRAIACGLLILPSQETGMDKQLPCATLQRCNVSSLRLFLLHAPTACPPHLLDHRPKPELTVSGTAMRHGRPWLPWSVQGPGPARSNRILSQFTSKTTNWRLGQSIRRRSEGKAGFGALGPGFSMSCSERRRARF